MNFDEIDWIPYFVVESAFLLHVSKVKVRDGA